MVSILVNFPFWVICLLSCFVLSWVAQIIFQIAVWQRPLLEMLEKKEKKTGDLADASLPSVSVIVYSHNQAEDLAKNLPLLLSQDFPQYEVIVVDDNSTDNTEDVLQQMLYHFPHLQHSHIDATARALSHRKLAIFLGAKASHYEVLLTTHAGCRPASKRWLVEMMEPFANERVQLVQGAVVYGEEKGLTNTFYRYDLFQRLLLFFGISYAVRPFAGWGQNLAFRKKTYYAHNGSGIQRHLKLVPGEDDLFVSVLANKRNMRMVFSACSTVYDLSQPLWVRWARERLNRGFTSRYYSFSARLTRKAEYLTRYLTLLLGIALMVYFVIIGIYVSGQVRHQAFILLGSVFFLLMIRLLIMVRGQVRSAQGLQVTSMPWMATFLDGFMPLVDIWFRLKAVKDRNLFRVSWIERNKN